MWNNRHKLLHQRHELLLTYLLTSSCLCSSSSCFLIDVFLSLQQFVLLSYSFFSFSVGFHHCFEHVGCSPVCFLQLGKFPSLSCISAVELAVLAVFALAVAAVHDLCFSASYG